MPLDTKTMFQVQRRATILEEGERLVFPTNKEYEKVDELFSKLQHLNPKLFQQLRQRFWETVALEILKMQTQTPTAKTT